MQLQYSEHQTNLAAPDDFGWIGCSHSETQAPKKYI